MHASGDQHNGEQIDQRIAGIFADGDRRCDHHPIESDCAQRLVRLEHGKAFQFLRVDPAASSACGLLANDLLAHRNTQALMHNRPENRTAIMVNQL
ncbi:hypothetical protein D9M70_445480 [compost metagenome]